MIVHISAEAEADLESIGDHIARDNPYRALSFVRELRGKCLDLSSFPDRFAPVAGLESQGVRCRPYGNYLIFYRVGAARLTVLHVLHGAMDYGEILLRS